MAPVIKPAAVRPASEYEPPTSSPHNDATKRKSDEDIDEQNDTMSDSGNEEQDDLKLLRTTKKTGEGSVSKRTLQNRKAQREFRKRREARVRELEERCRRYDQMGLEANTELQRVAQTLKEENNALRGFIMRMGMGHVVPNILQGAEKQGLSVDSGHNINEQTFQPTFAGAFGDGSSNGPGDASASFGGPTFFMENNVNATNASMNASRNRSGRVERERSQSANDQATRIGGNRQGSNFTLAPAPSRSGLTPQGEQGGMLPQYSRKASSPASSSRSTHSSGGASSRDAPLLSLDLANMPGNSTQDDQNVTRTAQQPSMDALFGNSGGSGMGGTAMLPNNFSGFSVPHRNQQNSALLNPNPIPFSFNLSTNGGDSGLQATWWDQVGGGLEPFELDDKAQAVANAQMGAQQAQSPFDLSAFLQGGVTPGGGFQLGNLDGTQEQATPASTYSNNGNTSGSNKANGSGTDTEHMRMFVKLMERKMAERDARRYASLGFQPPSQDPAQRGKQDGGSQELPGVTTYNMSSSSSSSESQLSPSVVYSRLAQHPAFLSTNARELEELVDALGPSTVWNSQSNRSQHSPSQQHSHENATPDATLSSGKGRSYSMAKQNSAARLVAARNSGGDATTMQSSLSGSGRGGNSNSMQVDERAIGKLFGLLDKKRGIQMIKGLPGTEGDEGQQNGLSMAMT